MAGGRLLEDGDELALAWDELADGRPWPLIRGRDFFVNPKEVEEAAQNAAARIGKAAQTTRTLRASTLAIWVQFADYRIEPGMPCPCGSDDLRRINDEWAICAICESTLLVDTRPKGTGAPSPIVVDAAPAGDDSDNDHAARLRIFVSEGARMGDERKRLAALRGASGEPKSKAAAERKEAQAREREEKKEEQAREREEKAQAEARQREERRAQVRQKKDDTRLQRQAARELNREQQRQRRESERGMRSGPQGDTRSGPKPRSSGEKKPQQQPRPQQSNGLTLDRFTNVRLWAPDTPQAGRFWGYGYDRKGRFVLLEVTLQLTPDGAPVEDPGQPGRALHAVNAVRSAPFAAAVDPDALLARTDGIPPEKVLSLASH